MKILAICGSPHKGNCYSVLNSIKENNPTIDFKILMLNDVNLEMCRGCYVCFLKGEENCPLKDDRDLIIKEMLDADGTVFASPVYANHISTLMKHFINRLGYVAHRPCFYGKHAMVMAICAGFGAEKANEYMSGIFSVFGFNVVTSLELKIATKSEKEITYNHEKITNAFETFLNGIKKGQGKLPTPTVTQLIYFNIFKAVSEWNKEVGKADHLFYMDKIDFYYDAKLNYIRKTLAKWIAGKEIRKMMMNR